MLFNSPAFIFAFLPAALAGFFLLARFLPMAAAAGWLVAVSLLFYAWWNPLYVLLLLASIAGNFFVGRALSWRAESGAAMGARRLLAAGVGGNLLLLGYYKYASFFADVAGRVAGVGWQLESTLLPLGISFYTFTQIAYLVDAYRGKAREYSPLHYALFVSYFPHLVAGPILHHREMMPQFADPRIYRARSANFAVGLSIFAIGLFKKVILADGVAPFANRGFDIAATGQSLSFVEAWGAALAYTVQLYFDFSGYSDMAIGVSRMFGVQLPINFHSPYKAQSIVEFWRRWHMTLSRFLRDYLYIPLGGSRRGTLMRYVNLMTTMLLGGLWHGAGWTFIAWGALHGGYLVVNHAWSAAVDAAGLSRARKTLLWRLAGWALTLACVVVAWVFFRADSVATALAMLSSMAGMNGVTLPAQLLERAGVLGNLLLGVGVTPGDFGPAYGGRVQAAWTAALLLIALALPNTQQLMARFEPGLSAREQDIAYQGRFAWKPSVAWAIAVSGLLFWTLLHVNRASDFLYWQF